MKYLVHAAGAELYRSEEAPRLRAGEAVIYIDPAESEADLIARLRAGQAHTLTTARAAASERITAEYQSATVAISAGYPPAERESWPVQTAEARALMADPDASTPWIDAAAAAREIDRAELAARIVGLDDAYRMLHGRLSGIRQRLVEQTGTSQTVSELDDVRWPEVSS